MRPGYIIQITQEDDPWYPCLLIVSEVKSWGVQAYVLVPNSNDGSAPTGQAYRRLKTGLFKHVGNADIVADEEKETPQ